MITPTELLDFALHTSLAGDRGEGTETLARRAVSAAYYAVFHMIAQAGASLVSVAPELRQKIVRSYDHKAVAEAARQVETSSKVQSLRALAASFKRLKNARERADYDLAGTMTWTEAGELVNEALHAHNILQDIRGLPETTAFLIAPLIKEQRQRG